jgi:hypothetical protein
MLASGVIGHVRNIATLLSLTMGLLGSCASGGGIWKSVAFSAPTSRWGMDIRMGYMAEGLYPELFSIDFSSLLRNVSDARIPLDVINLYTTAVIDGAAGYSGFLDYRSPYKDSWFTVMLVKDTQVARGWLLSDPDKPESFKPESLTALVMSDQAIIYSLSRRNIAGEPRWTAYDTLSSLKPDSVRLADHVDSKGRSWTRMDAVIGTKSSLSDPRISRMSRLFSFRFYTGQANDEMLAGIEPWHPVDLIGRLYARHFDTSESGVFVLVFFNGARFITDDGTHHDTWTEALITDYERMFESLEIDLL